jgi:hypothetical protein
MPFQLAFCAVNSHAGQLLANLTYDSAQLPQSDARTIAASLRDRLTAEAADGPRS